MSHPSPAERLAIAERDPADAPDAHLAACERCRAEVEALREVLRVTAATEVPEPSPLFWEHLSRRVADAVRGEPAPARAWRRDAWRGLAPLGAAAAVVLVAVSVWLSRPGIGRPADPASPARVVDAGGDAAPAAISEDGDDEAWQVVASLAEGVGLDAVDATGLDPAPGSVEEAARELTVPEREELIRILRAETAEASGTEG